MSSSLRSENSFSFFRVFFDRAPLLSEESSWMLWAPTTLTLTFMIMDCDGWVFGLRSKIVLCQIFLKNLFPCENTTQLATIVYRCKVKLATWQNYQDLFVLLCRADLSSSFWSTVWNWDANSECPLQSHSLLLCHLERKFQENISKKSLTRVLSQLTVSSLLNPALKTKPGPTRCEFCPPDDTEVKHSTQHRKNWGRECAYH